MALELDSGSQLTVGTTEHVLNTTTPNTTQAVLQVFVDLNAMQAGDTIELRVKDKARAGDTQRTIYLDTLTGVQSEPLWASPALIVLHGWDVTIKQTGGTNRSFPWSIRTT